MAMQRHTFACLRHSAAGCVAQLVRPQHRVEQSYIPLKSFGRQQRRSCSTTAAGNFFDAIDQKLFQGFESKQINLRNTNGRRVALIPMQHIASSKFYDSVLEEVTQNKYYLVLMEGVLDSVDQLKQEDTAALRIASDDELRSHLIQKVADNAHYDPKDEEALFASSYVQYPPPAELNLVHQELYFKARLLCRTPLKAKNSDVTRDRILAIEDPVDQRFFITDGRSDHCAKVLRGFLDEPLQHYDDSPGGDTIAVCWGDEHCKHLLEDLLTRGFEVESEGPTRPYGWSEELYNDTAAKWQAAGKSFNPILA